MDTENPNTENPKPTFEERMQALAQNLELLSVNIHEMQEQTRKHEALQEQLDARERKGREALLSGIAAYLKALGSNGGAQ